MAGLDPAIHVLPIVQKDVDARVIPDQVGDRRLRMTMGKHRDISIIPGRERSERTRNLLQFGEIPDQSAPRPVRNDLC